MDLVVVSSEQPARIADLLIATGLARCLADAKRAMSQRSVSVNGAVVDNPDAVVGQREGWFHLRLGSLRHATIYLAAPL